MVTLVLGGTVTITCTNPTDAVRFKAEGLPAPSASRSSPKVGEASSSEPKSSKGRRSSPLLALTRFNPR